MQTSYYMMGILLTWWLNDIVFKEEALRLDCSLVEKVLLS